MPRLALALLLALSAPSIASGQEDAPPPWTSAPAPRRLVSVTLSPIHLLIGMVELTGELRLTDQASVALIGGMGRMTAYYTGCPSFLCTATVRIYEVGAQGRWYFDGFDRGLHLGGEVTYLRADASDPSIDVRATAEGLTAGPFVGWRFMGQSGFTFDLQGGLQLLVIPGRSGSTSTTKASQLAPLLNANLGWSF